jgi:hypothetical protein
MLVSTRQGMQYPFHVIKAMDLGMFVSLVFLFFVNDCSCYAGNAMAIRV